MEEAFKNRLILILAVLSALLFIATLGSCNNAFRQRAARDKEMVSRLDLEESMAKSSQENQGLEQRVKTLEKALEEEKAGHETDKKNLAQERLVNESLKEELAKVTKLKEALEEDLKEALVSDKSAKSKMR